MTWLKKGAISLGDEALYPFKKNADLGSVIRLASKVGIKWMRVGYYPALYRYYRNNVDVLLNWQSFFYSNVLCLPAHAFGFGPRSLTILKQAVATKRNFIVSAHPLGLSLNGHENIKHFNTFIDQVCKYKDEKKLIVSTVEDIYFKDNKKSLLR